MVAIIFHSWSRLSVSVSHYFHVCSLPLLAGEGLPARWFQHVCGVLTLAMHAEAVVMLWTRDVDPSCTFFQFICILCEHRWKGTLTWPCRKRWSDGKNSTYERKENQRARCERCCSWEARARVCPFKQVGEIYKGLSQSFIIPVTLQQMRHVKKWRDYSKSDVRKAHAKYLVISVLPYGLSPQTERRLEKRVWTFACNIHYTFFNSTQHIQKDNFMAAVEWESRAEVYHQCCMPLPQSPVASSTSHSIQNFELVWCSEPTSAAVKESLRLQILGNPFMQPGKWRFHLVFNQVCAQLHRLKHRVLPAWTHVNFVGHQSIN